MSWVQIPAQTVTLAGLVVLTQSYSHGAARPAGTYHLSRAILCTCQNPEAVGRW